MYLDHLTVIPTNYPAEMSDTEQDRETEQSTD